MTMRLADGIRLGSTLMAPCSRRVGAYVIGRGCALDMAAKAVGRRSWPEAQNVWPWLELSFSDQIQLPSDLVIGLVFDSYFLADGGNETIANIAQPFSLDRFADWVDSIDPTPRIEPQEPSQVEVRQEKVGA